jgi:Predicted nucleotide-utilizing enzyme related to molybdopterin-biosynthesis enzyme MoeA
LASSKSVTACVLIIGNEILSGRTQDINLNYISKILGKWGIQVREARVIPDVEETIIETRNSVRKHYD